MSLREDLARRLTGILNGTMVHTETSPEGFPGMTRADMGPVADECIRQMEWARQKTTYVTSIDYDEDEVAWGDLTLAPPDWKPE